MTGFPSLDPQFDHFLYASLCEHDEMTVSVLSVLTRQDIDPWQLAARLSQVPKDEAVKTLASIVEESDTRRWSPSEAIEVAARLIDLLPQQNNFSIAPPSMESLQGHLMIWMLYGVFWGALALYGGNPQQTGKNYNGSPVASTVVSQQTDSSPQQPNTD